MSHTRMIDPPNNPTFQGLFALVTVYFGALGFAAITSPWVYNAIQSWHASAPNVLTEEIADNDLEDYFDRQRWLWVLICLPWLVRSLRFSSWREAGFAWAGSEWKRLLSYFGLGLALLAALGVLRVSTASAVWEAEWGAVPSILMKSLIGAVILAILEESVFRTLIWRAFSLWRPVIGGLVLSSIFFAYTHYKMPKNVELELVGAATVADGFFIAGWTLVGVVRDATLLDFLNLSLLGVWLTMLRLRSGSLAPCIGLHAGIVFGLLVLVRFVDFESAPHAWLLGNSGMRDGIFATAIFLAGILLCSRNSTN
ncbi:MAG: CPBP family intramembrane metalloprotease [Opitutales bacterium]|nr:CPBP family intramembrane metalloprotease [Opitutales bacterium]